MRRRPKHTPHGPDRTIRSVSLVASESATDLKPEVGKETASTEESRKERALRALHLEIDCFVLPFRGFGRVVRGKAREVLLAPVDEKRPHGPYARILEALREFVCAGGRPFEDKKFRDFFQDILRIASDPEECIEEPLREIIKGVEDRNEGMKYRHPGEQAHVFVKIVLRLSGAELKQDGTINLRRSSAKHVE